MLNLQQAIGKHAGSCYPASRQCSLSAFLLAKITLHIITCPDPGGLPTIVVMAAALPSLNWHSDTRRPCQRVLDCIFSIKP